MSESLAVRTAGTSSTTISDDIAPSHGSTAIAHVHQVLDVLAARDVRGEILTAVRHYPAREAQWADFPAWTHMDLRAAYLGKGLPSSTAIRPPLPKRFTPAKTLSWSHQPPPARRFATTCPS